MATSSSILVLAIILSSSLLILVSKSVRVEAVESHNAPELLPNILILFADNLAFDDVSVFSSSSSTSTVDDAPSRTPNVDSLAASGLKLTNWNSVAHLCSASRASLLTGRYPVRSGVYPGTFKPTAASGLSKNETTLADLLRSAGYATSIVGKWHLGHRPDYLPTNRGFDEWIGVPYHMSGGSVDGHECGKDVDPNGETWLPLYRGTDIVEQPVDLSNLAAKYADAATSFVRRNAASGTPFFLYVPFSHVHQLCAPDRDTCQWSGGGGGGGGEIGKGGAGASAGGPGAVFVDAVSEMDWITGQILDALHQTGVEENTFVLFTSDNGPWLAEQNCAGSKGPFEGKWLADNVDPSCTACPGHYVASPTPERPRRCVFGSGDDEVDVDGVHCGQDVGLGSCWEANVIMPALARWPGRIPAGSVRSDLVSTLDVFPTVLGFVGSDVPANVDGKDIGDVLLGTRSSANDEGKVAGEESSEDDRVLFFWRDGFESGPLPPPYGRFDVAAVKVGRIKAWIYTKSAHYNADAEVYHDPPLLFDVMSDPAESSPLDPAGYEELIERVKKLVKEHKASVDWTYPLALAKDDQFIPCVNKETGCRTTRLESTIDEAKMEQ